MIEAKDTPGNVIKELIDIRTELQKIQVNLLKNDSEITLFKVINDLDMVIDDCNDVVTPPGG